MFCKHTVPWLYRLEKNHIWESGEKFPEDYVFYDRKGKVRLVIEKDGRITVTKRFSWDGCSPKFCLFDIVIGPPEGAVHRATGRPKTYYASMVHDTCYQFIPDGLPIGRLKVDCFFYRILKENDFILAEVYTAVVVAVGWFFWIGKRHVRKHKGRRERLEDLRMSMKPCEFVE